MSTDMNTSTPTVHPPDSTGALWARIAKQEVVLNALVADLNAVKVRVERWILLD